MDIAGKDDISTPRNAVVVYSISFQPDKRNQEDALQFIKENPDKMMIENTPCGIRLLNMKLEASNELNPEKIMKIWAKASERFIAAASGNITAFVTNADPRSVFRTTELPNILKNEKITSINNMDKFLFAKRFS